MDISRYIFIIGSMFYLSLAHAQRAVSLRGVVLKAVDSTHVEYIKAQNVTTGKLVDVDEDGTFYIECEIGDSILFSSDLEYADYVLEVNETLASTPFLKVYVEEEVNVLPEVVIEGYPSFQEMVDQIMKQTEEEGVDLNLPQSDLPKKNEKLEKVINYIRSPISSLFNQFSKQGREKRKLAELIERDKQFGNQYQEADIGLITAHLNSIESDKAYKITEAEVKNMLVYCNTSPESIRYASTYELLKIAEDCYDIVRKKVR